MVALNIHGFGFSNPSAKFKVVILAGWGTALPTNHPQSRSIKVQYQNLLGPARLINITGIMPEEVYLDMKMKYFANIAITEFGNFGTQVPQQQLLEEERPKKQLKGKEVNAKVEIFDENGKRIK